MPLVVSRYVLSHKTFSFLRHSQLSMRTCREYTGKYSDCIGHDIVNLVGARQVVARVEASGLWVSGGRSAWCVKWVHKGLLHEP